MRKIYISISLVITTILVVNLYYYFDIYRQQIDFQKNFLINQTQICSYEIEKRADDFENELNYVLFSEDFSRFFSDPAIRESGIQKLELLYANYSTLVNNILVYDNRQNVASLYKDMETAGSPTGRPFAPNSRRELKIDFFTTNTQKELRNRDEIVPDKSFFFYYLPIIKDNQVVGNIEVTLNIEMFIYDIFSKYHVEDIQWQWLIDSEGNIILNNLTDETFEVPELYKITGNLSDGFMGDLQHEVLGEFRGKSFQYEVISVYLPTRIMKQEYGVVFSLQTDYIKEAIVINAVLIAGITLFLVGLIIFIFLSVIKQKNREEKKLRESEYALKNMVESLPIGILILGPDKRVRNMNRTAGRLFKTTPEQLTGAIYPDILLASEENHEKDNYSPFNQEHVLHYKKDEEEVVLYRKEIPLHLNGEDIILEALMDITPVERARKQEAAANQAKSDFLAKMSHEIRTPLHGIMGMTEALERSKLSGEQAETVCSIKKSAELLLSVIADILDFSKIEAGKMMLEEIPFFLRKEMDIVYQLFHHRAEEKNIDLKIDIDPAVPDELIGDPFRIRQVLSNLLDNAVKFTPSGSIQVNIKKTEDRDGVIILRFVVEDTGIGIPQEKLEEVFGSFRQGDNSASRKYGGMGLGTTISKQLVEMMNGQIRVESPASQSNNSNLPGTRFVFTVTVFSNEKLKKNIEYKNVKKYHQIKTLIILQKNTNDDYLLKTLHNFGVSTYLNFYQDNTIDLIKNNAVQKLEKYKAIIIKHTRTFDGFRVLKRFREEGLTNEFLIILISSHDERNNRIRARRLGVDYYIIEPFESSELFDIIQDNFPNIEPEEGETPPLMKIKKDISILVADDNFINQKVAQAIFKNLGYEIDMAADGKEVIEKTAARNYDIIFMDVMMPEMDGFEAADELRKQGKEMPIIAVTADTNQESRVKSNHTSMNDFIAKPIKVDEIKRVLIRYFSVASKD
ncbi:MAG: response regulator [Bacteroidales bacterium]